jgi:hypothetical protein
MDQTWVLPNLVVVHNQKGVIHMKGGSRQYYQRHRILLDSGVQPLMLGKATVEGLRLTNVNLEPCL